MFTGFPSIVTGQIKTYTIDDVLLTTRRTYRSISNGNAGGRDTHTPSLYTRKEEFRMESSINHTLTIADTCEIADHIHRYPTYR
jgi:hypothetical protein